MADEQKIQAPAPDGQVDAERKPTPEEIEAALSGKNRRHFEGLGDQWVVLTGQQPGYLIPQVIGTVLHQGGSRGAWQWQRKGQEHVMMAWPADQPVRAGVLMSGEAEGKLQPRNVVPLLEGLPNDLTVDAVHPWQNGLAANVAVAMLEGKNPMWFHDPFYGRDADDLTPGVTHTFLLSALAFGVRKALLDEVTITQGPRYEAYAEAWLAENPGKTRLQVPPLKMDVADKHLILPGRNFCEYQVRAVVEKVDDCTFEKMPVKVLYTRFPFDDRPSMLLPIFVSKLTLGELEPVAGMNIDAYVWLQGRIIDFDPQAAEPDATTDNA